MPAGISWGKYLKFTVASFASMFAGSTVVHWIYRPNLVKLTAIIQNISFRNLLSSSGVGRWPDL